LSDGRWTIEIVKRSDTAQGFVLLPGAGSSSPPSLGSADARGLPKTSRLPSPAPKP